MEHSESPGAQATLPASKPLAEPVSALATEGLSLLVPCYNEEGAIAETLEKIKKTLDQLDAPYEFLIIDDGSADRTAEIAEREGATVVSHEINQGYGAALKTGLRTARYGWIAITDADGTYPIEELLNFARDCGRYDMVIGARTGEHVKIPLIRRPAKWFINQLANYLTGHKIPDLNSGLRVFRKDLAERFISLFPDGFSFTTTITVASLCTGYRVKFTPINYFRRVGTSSISPIRDTLGFITLVVRLTTYFKPLNVFLPPALLLMLFGMSKAVFDLVRTNAFGVGSSLMVLTGLQLGFLGLLADLILRRTKL